MVKVDRDIMVLANPEIANLPNWVIALVAAGGIAAALSTANPVAADSCELALAAPLRSMSADSTSSSTSAPRGTSELPVAATCPAREPCPDTARMRLLSRFAVTSSL